MLNSYPGHCACPSAYVLCLTSGSSFRAEQALSHYLPVLNLDLNAHAVLIHEVLPKIWREMLLKSFQFLDFEMIVAVVTRPFLLPSANEVGFFCGHGRAGGQAGQGCALDIARRSPIKGPISFRDSLAVSPVRPDKLDFEIRVVASVAGGGGEEGNFSFVDTIR